MTWRHFYADKGEYVPSGFVKRHQKQMHVVRSLGEQDSILTAEDSKLLIPGLSVVPRGLKAVIPAMGHHGDR